MKDLELFLELDEKALLEVNGGSTLSEWICWLAGVMVFCQVWLRKGWLDMKLWVQNNRIEQTMTSPMRSHSVSIFNFNKWYHEKNYMEESIDLFAYFTFIPNISNAPDSIESFKKGLKYCLELRNK